MPFLDIAISQPCSCFHNNIFTFSSESSFHSKLVIDNDRRLASSLSWKSITSTKKVGKNINLGRIEVCRGGLTVKAVAALEITNRACKNEELQQYRNTLKMDIDSIRSNAYVREPQASGEDSTEVDERERLRRSRISKANKGNTPWNKGKKHSPETLQRIKERTRMAMQDPKVKMKLVNLGHAQSEETRIKIGVGVRSGWERRREKLMLQETCYYEWKNLIAASSREGLLGEEEVQWDSYKILKKQYDEEWHQSVELRKNMSRPKGSKRAPKSSEQKKKIAAAIAAKWADPEYRDRVCSGLAKFYGTPEGVERKPRKKPSIDEQTRKTSTKKKVESNDLAKHETKDQRIRLKKSSTPLYKDPFASSKLEMLKNIRAQRVAAMNKKSEAISRAKLLIAEAEKAATALEIASKSSTLARASLLESREIISEAISFIKLMENGDPVPCELSDATTEPLLQQPDTNTRILSSSDSEAEAFSLNAFALSDTVNGNAAYSCYDDLVKAGENSCPTSYDGFLPQESINNVNCTNAILNLADPKRTPNGIASHGKISLLNGEKKNIQSGKAEGPKKQVKKTKIWVCGRLVEVEEQT
ncbi:uncharacterized protein LOC142543493 [Primulina tabacum]|uniref:uncharacterized protein LOC142543493 n=1 Tax=Primulina tabacum TaxID=48773 RepID=UPI003F5940FB